MGNILISGVISKGGSQPFNAIEFYAVGEGGDLPTYTDYSLLQEGGVPQSGTMLFSLDGGSNTPIVQGTFWRITDDATAFEAYFGEPADYVTNNLSLFDGTNIVDLGDNDFLFDRYGEIGTNSWNYGDGWAYRNDGFNAISGSEAGNRGTFDVSNWDINQGAVAGCTENGSCSATFPLGTYSPTVSTTSSTMATTTTTTTTSCLTLLDLLNFLTEDQELPPPVAIVVLIILVILGLVDLDCIELGAMLEGIPPGHRHALENKEDFLDLFTKPDQAVGDTGMRDTLGGALVMLLDLFKDYGDDGGRRGLRAAAVNGAPASKEDMEKLKTELIEVLNELRE